MNVLYKCGNTLIISSKSHPVSLVQFKITESIKENSKVYFITNEGADDYINHCKDLYGEYRDLSDIDNTSFKRLNVNSCGEESEWKNHTY